MTFHWKAVEQCFTVVLFIFQFYQVCNFGQFINFGLGTVRSEGVKSFKVIEVKYDTVYTDTVSPILGK